MKQRSNKSYKIKYKALKELEKGTPHTELRIRYFANT